MDEGIRRRIELNKERALEKRSRRKAVEALENAFRELDRAAVRPVGVALWLEGLSFSNVPRLGDAAPSGLSPTQSEEGPMGSIPERLSSGGDGSGASRVIVAGDDPPDETGDSGEVPCEVSKRMDVVHRGFG